MNPAMLMLGLAALMGTKPRVSRGVPIAEFLRPRPAEAPYQEPGLTVIPQNDIPAPGPSWQPGQFQPPAFTDMMSFLTAIMNMNLDRYQAGEIPQREYMNRFKSVSKLSEEISGDRFGD